MTSDWGEVGIWKVLNIFFIMQLNAMQLKVPVESPVHLELTMIKSHHARLNVVMVGPRTSVFYSENGEEVG